MSKSKINVVWSTDEGKFEYGFVEECELENFEYHIGQKVVVQNNLILSNFTKGVISGFSLSSIGTPLAHVNWLEGAPPLRIRLDKIKVDQARKVWMLVQRNETVRDGIDFATGSRYMEAQRGIYGRRFFTREDAEARARQLVREFGHEVLILQSVAVCNAEGQTRTIK